jgi:hypothetical protein
VSISNFVPEIWSSEILVNLRNALVYGALCNRDYEGDIAEAGDTVHITSFGAPTISSYSKYTPLNYEQLSDDTRALTIDQQKSFSFAVDDIDKRQALGGFVGQAMSDAAHGLAEVTDIYLAGVMKAAIDGGAQDLGAITIDISNANAYGDVLVAMRTKLNRSKCPKMGRWAVVPPEVYAALLQDSRFVDASQAADSGRALREGAVGRVVGFDIFESNNVPTDTTATWNVIAGHPLATTYAEQIIETEALRLQDYFGDGLRGLHVYGSKVVRTECLAMASCVVQA